MADIELSYVLPASLLLAALIILPRLRKTKHPVHGPDRSTCFRISGIPSGWNRKRFVEVLQTIYPDLHGAKVSGPFPNSYDNDQTALLELNECTPDFTSEPNQKISKVIEEKGRGVHLFLDNVFDNLTPLNRAEEPIKMELVNP